MLMNSLLLTFITLSTILTVLPIPFSSINLDFKSYPWPDNVTQYSGYITVNQSHGANFFYWAFESRNKPSSDPLVLWLTGGPGCASGLACLVENGPFLMNVNGRLDYNKYGWNSFANLIYLDQPAGTGYSYVKNPLGYERNEKTIAREITTFMEQFYAKYSKFANLDFYIIGESYAGHYVPALSAYILQSSSSILKNFKGIAIGNGWVDPKLQYSAYAPFMYQNKLISDTELTAFKAVYLACEALIDLGSIVYATDACNILTLAVREAAEVTLKRSINVYDIRIPCQVPPLCYDFDNVTTFFNKADVRAALNVNNNRSWADCNMGVHILLLGDWMKNFQSDVSYTLSKGIRVLVYSGNQDFICNYVGGSEWVYNMDWSGKSTYDSKNFTQWNVNGKEAGKFITVDNLTFLEVDQAGHMVPMDQPANSLDMLDCFLNNKPFDDQ